MVPSTEDVGVVPHREYVAMESLVGLTNGSVLTCVHRDVHPEVALLVCVLDKTVCTVEDALVAYV